MDEKYLLSVNIDSETYMIKPALPLAIRKNDNVQMSLSQQLFGAWGSVLQISMLLL